MGIVPSLRDERSAGGVELAGGGERARQVATTPVRPEKARAEPIDGDAVHRLPAPSQLADARPSEPGEKAAFHDFPPVAALWASGCRESIGRRLRYTRSQCGATAAHTYASHVARAARASDLARSGSSSSRRACAANVR